MKKILILFALACAFRQAWAQGVRYDSRVIVGATNGPSDASVPLLGVPNVSVLICTDPACSTPALIYLNQGLTTRVANPVTTKSRGEFGFWAAGGTYYKKASNDPQIYPFTLGGSGAGSGTVTSVSASNPASLFTVSVSNPATTPNLSFGLTTMAAHQFFGNGTGSAAAPVPIQPAFTDLSGTAAPAQLPVATTGAFGAVKPDGTTITISSGVISSVGGGGSTAGASGVVQKSNGSGAHVASSITDNGTTVVTTEPITAAGFNSTGAGPTGFTGVENTALSGASGSDAFWADSTSHAWKMNNNNGGAVLVTGIATPITSGHLAVADTNGYDLIDGGAPYSLPTASTSTLGGVKVDGTTITIASGVISAPGGGSMVYPGAGWAVSTGSAWTTSITPGTGVATFVATPTSANLASALTDETGTGAAVFATSPTLVTPTIGVATATSVNKVAITAPATSATLTIANGKTLTANNSITLSGTDSTTMTFPSASATIAQTIASGTATLGTSAIASGACATVVTVAATGVATTDAIMWNPNASIKAVTGYVPATTGGLSIAAYPTSGNVNFDVCNWSSSSITPGAVTLNWRVAR
jgi:hypothetical protein